MAFANETSCLRFLPPKRPFELNVFAEGAHTLSTGGFINKFIDLKNFKHDILTLTLPKLAGT